MPDAPDQQLVARIQAVSLDMGGVLVFPDHGMLTYTLHRHDIPHDPGRMADGHYHAMAAIDRNGAEPETFGIYTRAFLRAISVPDEQVETGAAALRHIMVPALWHQRIPGALHGARRLRDLGLRLGVTSNADGHVEDMLRRHEVVQIGPGPGVEVEVVTDSGLIGVHKPHPKVFQATADAMGLRPEEICHIGDSGSFDADGARNFGMEAVHVDPLGLCDRDHHHVPSLAAFAEQLAGDGSATGAASTQSPPRQAGSV
jgi:FMN phosphatase YigB (HAD superfamily)